jgi:chorismate dehydratase
MELHHRQKVEKFNIAAVSYLNTKPLLYGLLNSPIAERLNLMLDIPSGCATKLVQGHVDLALIPVAVIPLIPNAVLFSDYCIGAQNKVKTVGIFSFKPLDQLSTIILDFHSRTSVLLIQILLKEYWQLDIKFIAGKQGFESQIAEKTGGLIIGDRTMGLHEKYPYFYDLGEAWRLHTGLPFVFAAWVSNQPLEENFEYSFNQAMKTGLSSIPELLMLLPDSQVGFDLKSYFSNHIYYHLDDEMKAGMSLFFEKLHQHNNHLFN